MIGHLLAGRYKVLEVLSEGGFGQTYIVEDIHLPGKPKCVLKHLKPTSTDPDILATARRLFRKEAETLQQLGSHDQIPRLLAYFEEKREFYLVQELISGQPLSKELHLGKRWTQKQTIEMLIEVLGILDFVHTQGVIHRDIKPSNLIRRVGDRKLVLIDFGAIKQLRSQTALGKGQQRVTIAVGTPGYMPSEQIRRLPRPSSDIYALGMMGIQALTGVHPHKLLDDPQTGEVLWQHLVPVSTELAAILTKMTRYHFKDRYQMTTEVLEELQELADTVDQPKVEVTNVNTTLNSLTLEWVEDGEVKTHTISDQQHSKSPGKVRIGRDPQACDIILSEPTVSGLHVEIFFHSQKEKFYLRNLRDRNPPIVDGKLLLAGEMPLYDGSGIRLGQQNLTVSAIDCKQFLGSYTPAEYPTHFQITPLQSVTKTIRPVRVTKPEEKQTPTATPKLSPVKFLAKKASLLVGVSGAAVVSAIGVLALLKTGNLDTANLQQSFILQEPKLCRVVYPSGGKLLANLRPEPETEVGVVKQLSAGEKVLFVQSKGDFVQVKLADGSQGWIFGDEIQHCNANVSH